MSSWLRYAVGFLVAVHGYVYVPFAVYLVHEFQRSYGASRLLGSVFPTATARTATLAVHIAAGVMLLAAGVLVAFAPGAVVAWRTLAVLGGAIGVLAFLVSWNGRPTHLSEQGVFGAAASLAVVVAALTLAHRVA